MAASSPAVINDILNTPSSAPAAAAPSASSSSKSLRGLNKPKCIKCGNVARSRCPFQSCKSCCAKAQNPCHIHVLKGGSNIPEQTPSSSSPVFGQHSTDGSHPGNSQRFASFRQLSNNFAQFNKLQTPVRSRKPLTRKEAQVINECRFQKLTEFRNKNIEAENGAFDRYMRNVSLLEEIFCMNSALGGQTEDISAMNSDHSIDDCNMMVTGLKLTLRANPVRIENLRNRVQDIIDQGLRKLSKFELNDDTGDLSDPDEMGKRPKKIKSWQAQKASALSDLIDKLSKVRNEDDLKPCLEMKSQLFNRPSKKGRLESDITETFNEQKSKQKFQSFYSPPKWFFSATIGQESLSQIDAHFCSLEDIEDL